MKKERNKKEMHDTIVVNIPAIEYTYHCPLKFNPSMPIELYERVDPMIYERTINSINILLHSTIRKQNMSLGSCLCKKQTLLMYYGVSDGIRCVNEYLNNQNKTFPQGHSIVLLSKVDIPYLQYKIKLPSPTMPEFISQIINYTNTGTPNTLNTVEETTENNLTTKTYIQSKKENRKEIKTIQFKESDNKPEQQQQLPVNLPSSQSPFVASISDITGMNNHIQSNTIENKESDSNSFDQRPFQKPKHNSFYSKNQIQFDENTPLLK